MQSSTHVLSAPHTGARVAATVLKGWWDAYWKRRAQRVTVFMLQSLDDRGLHDIGLDRSEITSVVYGKLDERQLRYQRNQR